MSAQPSLLGVEANISAIVLDAHRGNWGAWVICLILLGIKKYEVF
jgi:hypothetical protein